jgi:hypothetical protein
LEKAIGVDKFRSPERSCQEMSEVCVLYLVVRGPGPCPLGRWFIWGGGAKAGLESCHSYFFLDSELLMGSSDAQELDGGLKCS